MQTSRSEIVSSQPIQKREQSSESPGSLCVLFWISVQFSDACPEHGEFVIAYDSAHCLAELELLLQISPKGFSSPSIPLYYREIEMLENLVASLMDLD